MTIFVTDTSAEAPFIQCIDPFGRPQKKSVFTSIRKVPGLTGIVPETEGSLLITMTTLKMTFFHFNWIWSWPLGCNFNVTYLHHN